MGGDSLQNGRPARSSSQAGNGEQAPAAAGDNRDRRRDVLDMLFIVFLSVFAWGALLAPGYFLKAHDAPHSVFYLLEFDKAFRDGSWYPRWGIDFALGYGYPLFSYYSPLAYYAAEAFHLLGAGLTDAIKLTYILVTLVSGLAMYGFVRRLFGRGAGLLAAAVYLFVPYHLLDLYVRCSFAEYCAFAFLPLVLWAFLSLIEAPNLRRIGLAALAYAGLILTHNATFLMFTPLLAAYCLLLLLRRRKHRIPQTESGNRGPVFLRVVPWLYVLAAGLLAFALSAALLLPAILERSYIAQAQWTQGSFNYLKHFTYLSQLISPFWGYGYAGEGPADDMSLQLGLIAVALTVMGLIWRPRRGRGDWAFFVAASAVLTLLMLPISAPAWQALPLVSLVQFPWRLLILTAVTLSITAGAVVEGVTSRRISVNLGPGLRSSESAGQQPSQNNTTRRTPPGKGTSWSALIGVLCLVAAFASQSYAVPQYTAPDPRSETEKAIVDFETFYPPDRVGMTAWVQQQPKTSPLVAEYLADQPLTRVRLLSSDGEAQTQRSGGASIDAAVRSTSGAAVQFNVYYFPGWEARVDGQVAPVRPEGPSALLTLDVPAGEHQLTLRFTDTPLGQLGIIISVMALVVTIGLCVFGERWGASPR